MTPHRAIGETPFNIAYGAETVLPAEIGVETVRVLVHNQGKCGCSGRGARLSGGKAESSVLSDGAISSTRRLSLQQTSRPSILPSW